MYAIKTEYNNKKEEYRVEAESEMVGVRKWLENQGLPVEVVIEEDFNRDSLSFVPLSRNIV